MVDVDSGLANPNRHAWEDAVFGFVEHYEAGIFDEKSRDEVSFLALKVLYQLSSLGIVTDLAEVQRALAERDAAVQLIAYLFTALHGPGLDCVDPHTKEQRPFWLHIAIGREEVHAQFGEYQIDPEENMARLTQTGFLTHNSAAMN